MNDQSGQAGTMWVVTFVGAICVLLALPAHSEWTAFVALVVVGAGLGFIVSRMLASAGQKGAGPQPDTDLEDEGASLLESISDCLDASDN